MQARQRTFMLLPDWNFRVGDPVALGRVIPIDKKTKLPDPEATFTSPVIPVPDARVNTQILEHWEHDTNEAKSVKGGVSADLSLFTGLGAGVKGNYGSHNGVKISSKVVRKLTFYPSPEELASIVKDSTVKDILAKLRFATVWVVTGLMVAEGIELVEKTGHDRGAGAHVNADFTATGAPLNLGVEGERSTSSNGNTKLSIKGDVLVAYQLVRLQKKITGVDISKEVRLALFNDDGAVSEEDVLKDIDIDLVAPREEETAGAD